MSRRSSLVGAVALVLLVSVVAACSSDDKTTATANSVSGSIKVSAAASLTEAFNGLQTTLKKEEPDLSITYNFGGSGALVTQIQQGAEIDVIAAADTDSMKKLQNDGSVEEPVIFAHNKLEILVQPGNPKQIKGMADLARPDIKFVTEDETVPAGKYSAQALANAGVTVSPVSKETDVKAAVAKVTSGEADATIVYQTDVTAAGAKGEGVEIPDAQNIIANYPIAILKATKNHGGAAAFVDAVVHGSGQDALQQRGFLAVT
jgi:molybdate transport system substrate-binding protein